jgi:hypothetical protein
MTRRPSIRPSLPLVDIAAIVIEREPVLVAIVLLTIFAVKREVDPLTADSAGPVYRVLLLPEEPREETTDSIPQSHGADVGGLH